MFAHKTSAPACVMEILLIFQLCRQGDIDEAEKLIVSRNVDVNVPDDSGVTLVHFLSTELHNPEYIRRMATKFAMNPNVLDDFHMTPLMAVCESELENAAEVADALCECGADVNARHEVSGLTALHFAQWSGNIRLMEMLLLKYNADINVPDIYGDSVLLDACAAGNESIVLMLLNMGADFTLVNNNGDTSVILCSENNMALAKQLIVQLTGGKSLKEAV